MITMHKTVAHVAPPREAIKRFGLNLAFSVEVLAGVDKSVCVWVVRAVVSVVASRGKGFDVGDGKFAGKFFSQLLWLPLINEIRGDRLRVSENFFFFSDIGFRFDLG